jgi:hypothetical protein
MPKFKVLQFKFANGRGYCEEVISSLSPIEAENENDALKDAKWIFGDSAIIELVTEKPIEFIKY